MGNVCGLMGNADANPSNDNLKPSGIAAEDDNILGKNIDFFNAYGESDTTHVVVVLNLSEDD